MILNIISKMSYAFFLTFQGESIQRLAILPPYLAEDQLYFIDSFST